MARIVIGGRAEASLLRFPSALHSSFARFGSLQQLDCNRIS